MTTERTADEERTAILAMLQLEADIAQAVAARRADTAATLEAGGHHADAEQDRRKADAYERIAAARRAEANRIEHGEA